MQPAGVKYLFLLAAGKTVIGRIEEGSAILLATCCLKALAVLYMVLVGMLEIACWPGESESIRAIG
jgi:hypothetical protein